MRAYLTHTVALKAKARKGKPYQIHDTATSGFILRIQPSGAKIWKLLQKGKTPRTLGDFPVTTAEMARNTVESILRGEDDDKVAPIEFADYVDKHYMPWVRANHSRPDDTLRVLNSFGLNDKLLTDGFWLANVETWRIGRQQEIAASTINRDTATLKAALQKAVDWGLLETNPLTRLKPLKTDRRKIVRYLKPDEEKRLMAALAARDERKRRERISANHWRLERHQDPLPTVGAYADNLTPLVVVALNTGLRRGELWNLVWGDIDLKRNVLTVHGLGAKSGQTRHIPLNRAAVDVLKTHRGEVRPLPAVPVFGSSEFKKSWAGVLKLAKIEQFRFHDLRHTFASKLVTAGVPLNTVRELMGHASLDMTLIYAHLAPDNLRAAVELL